jgi:hypothetical protein
MKRLTILVILFYMSFGFSKAQHALKPTFVGIYNSGIVSQIGLGTNIDRKNFGEIRLSANDLIDTKFGVEVLIHKNIYRSEPFNFHAGLMLGGYFYNELRVGVPVGLTIRPFESHRAFQILMEATPNFFVSANSGNIRANIGLRYSFR